MKKIFFATTALVATAGVAAADVTFGGYARWGMAYMEDAADETTISSRLRLIVTMSAESDAGLSFGAQTRMQLDNSEHTYTGGGGGFNPARFWVSYEGLEVSTGHVQGAFEFMPGIYDGSVGLTGLGYANVVYNYGADFYSSGGAGRQGIDIKYAMGDFSTHLSYSTDETGGAFTGPSDRLAVHGAYSFNDWTVAAAFQDVDDEQPGAVYSEWALTANGDLGLADVTLQVGSNDYSNDGGDDGELKYGVSGDFEVGAATTVTAFVNYDDALDGGDGGNNYGVGFIHDLGGGTSIRGGVAGLGNRADDDTQTRADLGVQFNF